MNNRSLYFDFLRGIAILMVIGIHCFPSSNFHSLHGQMNILIRQVLNCAVPLFLAISGFFLGRKTLTTRTDYFSFLKKQIPHVYIPCLIWSVPYLILYLAKGGLLKNLIQFLFCGYSVYYFIALIIQYYLLLPFLQRFKGFLLISALSSFISIFTISYLICVKGYSIPLLIYAGPFPVWFLFFAMGVYLSKVRVDVNLKLIILGIILSLIASYLETHYLFSFYGMGAGIKISAFVYSSFMILLLFSKRIELSYNERNFLVRSIRKVGDASFGIYFIHCYFIVFISKLSIENWFLKFFIALLCSYAFIYIIKKMCPSFSLKYLGFR